MTEMLILGFERQIVKNMKNLTYCQLTFPSPFLSI